MIPTISTKLLSFDKETNILSGEISSLQLEGFPPHFFIKSEKTGLSFMVEIDHREADLDGDILYYSYKPMDTTSSIASIRIQIFND